MAFQNKLPPIVIQLDKKNYDKLIYALENKGTEKSLKMKDNFIKYGYYYNNEVEIRLYPYEASYLIFILINYLNFKKEIDYIE